ncbi:MAG: CHRD domain-containing protein [Gammaproteobacteria bacterium]|nr:CHRD domain-containing protein [Gammaproteobacteria bacterium]NIR91237.1 CHRD domain-containing protein [Gammaproteobacteria bacterium]NIV52903.1 CHRD domain-containing protein [Gammaproteobacteria bacterium]NIW85174.1 CHRD domain-containing protein [Gammaproteobacteria bacterium]
MNRLGAASLAASFVLVALFGTTDAFAAGQAKARLSGFQVVPTVSSAASGEFVASVTESSVEYRLSYSGFETDVLFAHIHFGAPATNGGVSATLCTNAAPSSAPACPLRDGTASGTIAPADVGGPAGQGIAPGEFEELLDAIDAGATYVQVHSGAFPPGEIRGQIRRGLGRP